MGMVNAIPARDCGLYDELRTYRMFDVVEDARENKFVLIVPESTGRTYLDRNLWQPVAGIVGAVLPYQNGGDNAEVNALLGRLKDIGLMHEEPPELTVLAVGGTQTVEVGDEIGPISCLIVASDGNAVSYQWYSSETDDNKGGSLISGETDSILELGKAEDEGVTYYYCVGSAEGETIATDTVKVTIVEPEPPEET